MRQAILMHALLINIPQIGISGIDRVEIGVFGAGELLQIKLFSKMAPGNELKGAVLFIGIFKRRRQPT